MIVYGCKNKELARAILTDKCENCGTQNSIDMHVFQKYAHIFWIPLLPMGKTGVSQCDHCKQVLQLKQMPASLKLSYENLKAQNKTPIWTFSGLAVIAVLIAVGIVYNKKKEEKNAQLILSLQKDDILEIKIKQGQFTLYRVDTVEGDSVFVQTNNYETNKMSGLADLKEKGFSEDVSGFSKAELKQMLAEGEILDIDRK